MDKYQFDTTKGNRFGHVYNWDTNTLERGYYPTAIINIKNLVLSIGKDWPLLTKEEKDCNEKSYDGRFIIIFTCYGSWKLGLWL